MARHTEGAVGEVGGRGKTLGRSGQGRALRGWASRRRDFTTERRPGAPAWRSSSAERIDGASAVDDVRVSTRTVAEQG